MNNAGQHANGFTHGKNLDRTAGEFIGAPLKGRAKRKTVSLERLSTELSGALRDRRCAWSKDLSPTQQGTDRPFPPSTKDWEVLKPPKNSWRDHRVKSARRRGKVPSQSQSGDERYHDAPPPTASNRKDAQLSTTVCKRDDGGNHQSENFAQACRYLPRSLESSFSKRKKKKKGGYSTICLRPFVRGKINPEKLRFSRKYSPLSRWGHGVECWEILSWWYGVSQAIIWRSNFQSEVLLKRR